jgi:hypothetical protein
MKLGVSYTVFDGIELLEKSIDQIRQAVDLIQVIYQTDSWFGKKISAESLDILHKLKSSGKIDDLSIFTNFIILKNTDHPSIRSAKSFELKKRSAGLNWAKSKSCTHFMSIDVDEFYDTLEFKEAKERIIKEDISSSAVSLINYVNLPTIHRGFDSIRVPFICKIGRPSIMQSKFFVRCDPTRGISAYGTRELDFPTSQIIMHHMETVRLDLSAKYDSTSRAIFNRSKQNELIESISSVTGDSDYVYFNKIIFPAKEKFELFKVENKFDIHL